MPPAENEIAVEITIDRDGRVTLHIGSGSKRDSHSIWPEDAEWIATRLRAAAKAGRVIRTHGHGGAIVSGPGDA